MWKLEVILWEIPKKSWMVLWFIASTASVIQFYNFTYNRHIARGFHPKFPNSALLTSDEGCEPHQIIWTAAYLLPKFHFIQNVSINSISFKTYYKKHIKNSICKKVLILFTNLQLQPSGEQLHRSGRYFELRPWRWNFFDTTTWKKTKSLFDTNSKI